MIVALVGVVTVVVLMLNDAVVVPANTVTLTGTVADPFELDSVTTTAEDGAPLKLTVPVEVFPPTTVEGLSTRFETVSGPGCTTSVAVREPAVMVAVTGDDTGEVVTVNGVLVEPAGTATDDGTCAAVLLLETATTKPGGAPPLRVMVPVEF